MTANLHTQNITNISASVPCIIPVGEVLPPMDPKPRAAAHTKTQAPAPAKQSPGKRAEFNRRGGAVRRRFAMLNTFIDSALAELGRAELAAWLILYRHAKPDGIVTASVGDLARRAGCTGRTMQTALAKMQARGLLLRIKRGTLTGGPSLWRLLAPEPGGTTGKKLPVTTGKRLPV